MMETFRKGAALGLGFATAGFEKAEKVIDELVKKGEMTTTEAKAFLKEYQVKGEVKQNSILKDLNFATQDDVARLEARIDALAKQLNPEA